MRFGHFVIALFTVSLAVSTIAQTQNARRGASPDHLFVDPSAIKWESLPPGASPNRIFIGSVRGRNHRRRSDERGRAVRPSHSIDSGNAGASPLA